jgi:glycosyltransferase involved in cell wall biosynthesis
MDVAQLLLLANVFVYPSYFEGLPGALIEAMLAEKVIVCSNIPENLECVDEESAVIFERGDVNELSKKVNYAIGNERELKVLGIQARKIAAKKFDLGSIAAEYEATYEQLIEKLNQ